MAKKIKIYFVLPTLYAGGAERVMSFVSQNLDKEKFHVTLVVIGLEKDSKFKITGCPVIFLNKSRVLNGAFSLSRLIAKEKPDIVVSSISHLIAMTGLISLFFSKTIFIGRQAGFSGSASFYDETYKRKKSFLKKHFNYFLFGTKQIDHFICQSNDQKENVMKAFGIDSQFISVINNPITNYDIIKTKKSQNSTKKYITVGRLSKEKGQVRILRILSKLTFPFKYLIIGEGPQYDEILSEVEKLGLKDKVSFISYTNNVSEYLVKSDMFLQGSYSEGFPNALLESCAVGTPVIAFDAPGGTKEIIEDEINGFIVADEIKFLERLNDKKDWNPKQIRESVYKKFSTDKILSDYETLFKKLIK
ncbi:glycosyltransferase [Winogradskyella sp. SM1960]|uniref:glycosyltransferase n=1 Tax=Winogradskyella sp. SM1960 TaxID=2865955 RepID=UPI001CD7E85A|nr:glycosyltransferase [Winogradskyella sp. SM1960]